MTCDTEIRSPDLLSSTSGYDTPSSDVYDVTVISYRSAVLSVGELVIVILLVSAWSTSIFMFLRKWRNIRIVLPPVDGFRRLSPKNLDSVTVIGRDEESVIYPNYSRQIVSTFQARRDMLNKMQQLTAPINNDLDNSLQPTSSRCPSTDNHQQAEQDSFALQTLISQSTSMYTIKAALPVPPKSKHPSSEQVAV